MPVYKVVERQTVLVAYYVSADDETDAKGKVSMMGSDEFDELLETKEAEQVLVEYYSDM